MTITAFVPYKGKAECKYTQPYCTLNSRIKLQYSGLKPVYLPAQKFHKKLNKTPNGRLLESIYLRNLLLNDFKRGYMILIYCLKLIVPRFSHFYIHIRNNIHTKLVKYQAVFHVKSFNKIYI